MCAITSYVLLYTAYVYTYKYKTMKILDRLKRMLESNI